MDRVKRDRPGVPVILITAHGSEDVAVNAMKRGATDYLPKPLDLNRLRAVLEGAGRIRDLYLENIGLHRELDARTALGEIIGDSPQIRTIKEQIRQVAPTNATILVQGENGTGKELVANAIYAASDRAGKPFVKVAVGALPRDLLESELFGHEKGSFTGAHKQRKGRFELAHGGTLFLDEIGSMPIETQIRLLRVLQEREFERVGGTETIQSDIRLVSATNEDLEQAMSDGRFRQDLFYRINVIHINLPPLRERLDDIPLLVESFVKKFPARDGSVKEVSPDVMSAMQGYDWPGNVRELRNLIERLCVTAAGARIEASSLPEKIRGAAPVPAVNTAAAPVSLDSLAGVPLDELERQAIEATLRVEGGNKTRTAKILGIGLKTLYRKIEGYGIKT
jgi:two-component system response regulator HydG